MSLNHVLPFKTMIYTALALLVLTVLTVAVYYIDFPDPFNTIIALGIATVKAALVCMFFMGLYWDTKFNTLVLLSSLLFFLIMIGIILLDTLFREAPFQIYG